MPLGPRSVLFAAATLVTVIGACAGPNERPELLVGAASSLEPLFLQIEEAFEVENDVNLTYVFGASGTLARQIREGAPMDVFASADLSYMTDLVDDGLISGESMSVFGWGRLMAIAAFQPGPQATPITIALDSRVKNLAIANPEIAPYGAAARDLLQQHNVWEVVRPKVVFGENVTQVLQFVRSGNAQVGYVPLAFVREGVELER